ncbi:MAG TPA: ABC transporter ATP-binding protein [Patescibacteria group bacterium]|nr:ABC transporter ATP-binding protein [Patescibacteria group bacterium]
MSAPRSAAIDVGELRKDYDGRTILRGISFDVQPGEIVALLGPNGAGKTTTVEILEGYRRPDGGTARVLGTDPGRARRAHRARVGLMLQGGSGIDPRMTAREVVGLHARFHADPLDPDEILGRVGLVGATAATRYRRLSGGERQRVGLALALVGRPEVAILDEPTAGMDVEARAMTRSLLAGLRDEGVALLMTSHDLAEVERVADRIAILDRGRLVAFGRADALREAGPPVLRFRLAATLSEADLVLVATALDAGAEPGRAAVTPDGGPGRYRVAGAAATPGAIARLAAWCSARGALIVDLRTSGGTLEERYLELTGSAISDDDADPVR